MHLFGTQVYPFWFKNMNSLFTFMDFQEAANNDNGKAPHSSWRNYDDFNEYFW